MIYFADKSRLIYNIPTENIIAYLKDLSWNEIKTKRDNLFRIFKSENIIVTVPIDRTIADYSILMSLLIERISEAYRKDEYIVITELLNPNADILKLV